ncbi:MAG: leucyl aminopeptidase [Ktedonobacteraceae bacterium]
MNIQVTEMAIQDIACDAVIIGVTRQKVSEQSNVALPEAGQKIDALLGGLLHEVYAEGEFKGNLGELCTLHTMGKLAAKRVIVVGLGAQEKYNAQSLRRASAIAARHAQDTGAHSIALVSNWESDPFETDLSIQAQVEGVLLGLYSFRKYQHSTSNGNGQNGRAVTEVRIAANNAKQYDYDAAVHKGIAMAEATNFARDLVNEPPNVLNPTELANRASAMAKHVGLECEVLDRPKMEELGMGGLLGVSQGSAEPPKFIILRYRGAPDSKEQGLALVGKGITFDTGGISLKPAERMHEMKGDMAGAAAVISAMQVIATLKPAINVTALVSSSENMPSGTAYRPGDILRIMNGKTIEIVNTDAEGRLVLADALSYAVKEGLSPIVDVATLTGGVVVALGSVNVGLFSNNEELSEEIIEAGRTEGEKYWPLPLDDEYGDYIKSEIADIKQTGGRYASSVTAAKILEHFVGDAKWAHLDIAGVDYIDNKTAYQEKGATGYAVRTLAELALRLAK